MSNKWKNITSAFVGCVMAYLCMVKDTNSWLIINTTPANDAEAIATILCVMVTAFAMCRLVVEFLDCK